MNKKKNIVVTILVVVLIILVLTAIFAGRSDKLDLSDNISAKEPGLPESQVGRDSQRTDVNKLIADLQVLYEKVDDVVDAVNVIEADNKAQAQALNLIKDVGKDKIFDRLNPPANDELTLPEPPASQTSSESSNPLTSILPPMSISPRPIVGGKQPSGNLNEIVWINPMDHQAPESEGGFNINLETGVRQSAAKVGQELGITEVREPEPRYTVAHGSVIQDATSITALVGKIPIRGQVQDPWKFKLQTGANILMANSHSLDGLEGTIVEGTAIGNLALNCVTGIVETVTFIFNDGRIVTHKASDTKSGMGYISDNAANPCIPGELITNAPQVVGTLGVLGALEGLSSAYANQEAETIRNLDGSTSSIVIGSHMRNQLGNAGAAASAEMRQWFADRMDQYFDVVYVPAGQKLDIHISEEIQIDYDFEGRKIRYEAEVNSVNPGGMD